MSRFLLTLLFGALAVTCVLSLEAVPEEFEEEDSDEPAPVVPAAAGARNVAAGAALPAVQPIRPRPALSDTALSTSRAPKWTHSHGEFGPLNWGKYWPKCNQMLQAPINIERKKVISSVLKPVIFNNFEQELTLVNIENLFRYGVIDFHRCSNRVSIQGGPLPGGVKYYLSYAYIVVGKNRTHGSSTCIDKKKAPFEIAFVFNSNANATVETDEAGSQAILHFLGKIVPEDNPSWTPVIDGFKKVVKGGSHFRIPSIKSLHSLFPRKTWELNYFTYTGSSVTPPCTEGRIRIIYHRSLRLSAKQHKVLQGLYNEKGEYIWNNYRLEQPNNYVQVFSSVEKLMKPLPTTTMPPKANVIEDPYAPPPTRRTTTTSRPVPNVVVDPYTSGEAE